MKNIRISLLFCISILSIAAEKPKNQKSERAKNAQVVLANLAQMIGQVGNIIENPHNPDTVGDAVSGMVDNIVKITVHAVQQKKITLRNANKVMKKLYTTCKDFDNKLAIRIIRKQPIIENRL